MVGDGEERIGISDGAGLISFGWLWLKALSIGSFTFERGCIELEELNVFKYRAEFYDCLFAP